MGYILEMDAIQDLNLSLLFKMYGFRFTNHLQVFTRSTSSTTLNLALSPKVAVLKRAHLADRRSSEYVIFLPNSSAVSAVRGVHIY